MYRIYLRSDKNFGAEIEEIFFVC